jgi:transposase
VLFVRDLIPGEIQALARLTENPKTEISAQIIISSADGYRVGEIADKFSICRGTVSKWIHLFNKEGLTALEKTRFGQGRKRRHIARPLTDAERQQIERLNPYERKRLEKRIQIINLSHEGYSVTEIANRLNHGTPTIRRWITWFNQDGLAGLSKVVQRKDYQHSGGSLVSVVAEIRRQEGMAPDEPVPLERLQNRF